MISGERIAYWIALWYERVGRTPSAPVFAEYELALNQAGLSTDEFDSAARALYRTEAFLPPPAVFIGKARPVSPPNTTDIVRRIEQLGTYNANVGMIPPSPGTVRSALGPAVADAYASVGGRRLFSNDETARNIAERDFTALLTDAQRKDPRALVPPVHTPLLPPIAASVRDELARDGVDVALIGSWKK